MNATDGLLLVCIGVACWLVWLWSSEPRYVDGRYVSVKRRICKVSKRVFCERNKRRADDP